MTDFLNNLWVAVSTPNPELIKILSIPLLIFLEIPLTLYMLKSIFNITTNKRQNLLYIVILPLKGSTVYSSFEMVHFCGNGLFIIFILALR